MFCAAFGRAELSISKPDAFYAILLIKDFHFLGDLGRVPITLLCTFDLVIQAEVALEGAAAFGMNSDVIIEILMKVGEDGLDILEINRSQFT